MSDGKPNPTVQDRNPRVGDTLLFDDRRWEITDHSTYKNDEGFHVIEWCCELSDTEAYLLKERQNGEIRWFFTRWQPSEGVRVEKTPLVDWIRDHPIHPHWSGSERSEGPKPADQITYQGDAFTLSDVVNGTYEDDPGESESKTTWEYWDASHERNVAIEIWENGDVDVYQGAYVEPAGLKLEPEQRGVLHDIRKSSDNPWMAVAVLVPALYFLGFFIGAPFDQTMTFVLPAAFLGAAVLAAAHAPLLGAAAIALGVIGLMIYGRFAPLSTIAGLAASLALPAALSFFAKQTKKFDPPGVPRFLAGFTSGMPAMVHGLYHYVKFAPGPRSFGQWVVALLPAVIVGAIGCLLAHVVVKPGRVSDPAQPKIIS